MFNKILLLCLIGTVVCIPNGKSKIERNLETKLRTGETVNVIITFSQKISTVITNLQVQKIADRSQKIKTLHSVLERNAQISQLNTIKFLKQVPELSYKSFWITNQIFVKQISFSAVNHLSTFPEIESIEEVPIFPLANVHTTPSIHLQKRQNEDEWGIKIIQAREAIALLKNSSSTIPEIRVATIDTGVNGDHEALKGNWLGNYGWWDPIDITYAPRDAVGQGTHITGTILGQGGIGVFPDAKWMACRACEMTGCTLENLLDCAEYTVCPVTYDGNNRNCSMAAHVVMNSWGGSAGTTYFDDVILAWKTAGIVPVFSVGRSGPTCGSIGSPSDHKDVYAVGATTEVDAIWTQSTLGPALDGSIKPDITAPGTNILSASHADSTGYISGQGTGSSGAHVAGVAAILLAYNPDVDRVKLQEALFEGAEKDLQSSGKTCGDTSDIVFPNSIFGNGRANAYASLQRLIQSTSSV